MIVVKSLLYRYAWLPADLRRIWFSDIIGAKFAHEMTAARKAGDHQQVRRLQDEQMYESRMHDDEEDIALSDRLLRRATYLSVAVPTRPRGEDETEHWTKSDIFGRWRLSRVGVGMVRAAIRQEEAARRADRFAGSKDVIAVLGAISGVLAVLSRWFP